VLLTDGPLSFQEFAMHESLPLATVFREVFVFLAGRPDAVLFGAQAVNAYAATQRMTNGVDVMSTDAGRLVDELREHLASHFHIAVRTREVAGGRGFRLYQVQKPQNRHLVDVRQVDVLPAVRVVEGVQVVAPPELVAMKVESAAARSNEEKGLSDRLDLHRLLNQFPDLRTDGKVDAILRARSPAVLDLWGGLAREHLRPGDDDSW
jgi:hypothetical protein